MKVFSHATLLLGPRQKATMTDALCRIETASRRGQGKGTPGRLRLTGRPGSGFGKSAIVETSDV